MRKFSGRRLADHRLRKNLRPEHLAVHIGRCSMTVRQYEHGKIQPPADVVGSLADALDITVDDLFEQVDG